MEQVQLTHCFTTSSHTHIAQESPEQKPEEALSDGAKGSALTSNSLETSFSQNLLLMMTGMMADHAGKAGTADVLAAEARTCASQ